MTTEELFAQMEAQAANEKEYCVIDPITREISVPEVYKKIGVVSDEKTNRIYFQCPKIVGDNVDLTKYGIRVNYQNANGQTKPYPVDDVAVSGDNITFSWLLERPVTTYKGTINFVVCAIKTSGDEITNEWNTTLAQAEVLEGLEPDISITEDEESIVELLVAQCTQKLTEMNMAIQTAENATNNAKTATQESVNATEDARSVIEQITKDSYLHTALESFINEVTATPTAYGNALVEKIEGYIRQTSTKGNQLFDASKLASKTQGGATVTNNGDGSFTVSGNGNLREICSTSYDDANIAQKLKAGKIRLKTESNPYPYFYVQFRSSAGENVAVVSTNSKETDITSDDLTKITSVRFGFYGDTSQTIVPGTIKPMLYQDGDGTWEPFTGAEPAPSPDYPQVIHGVGDMGFFDGIYQYVYHDNSNALTNNPEWVSSINKVPCKTGDNIEIIYTRANSKSMYGIIYYKGDKFVSALAAQTGNGKFTVPSGVDGFQWQVYEGGAQPDPSKVIVTINGMYAICVKSKGVNLFNLHGKTEKSYGAETIYGNTARIEATAESNVIPGVFFYVGDIKKFVGKTLYLRAGKITSTESSGARMVVRAVKGGASVQSFRVYQMSAAGTWMTAEIPEDFDVSTADKLAVQLYVGGGVSTVTKGAVATFEEVMLCYEEHENYSPYQDSTTYIPISYPLFSGDQLIKRNMVYKILRKNGFKVYDSSEDEVFSLEQAEGYYDYYTMVNDAKESSVATINYFKNIVLYQDGAGFISKFKNLNLVFSEDRNIKTVEEFKNWLKSHIVFVRYVLATPIEEELTPEAQKAIYSIMACDEQTTIEIVGVPTDAEVQNQFLLPRNVDGALNTTAYCTAEKNKIVLNELVAQNLDARVNKLEIDNAALAEQTIIVE